jgi:hypothetical protein
VLDTCVTHLRPESRAVIELCARIVRGKEYRAMTSPNADTLETIVETASAAQAMFE